MTAPRRTLTDSRLGRRPLPSMIEAVYAPGLEGELTAFAAHIEVDLAHVVMLAEQKLISGRVAKGLLECLLKLRDGNRSEFNIDPASGSLLLQVERFIEERKDAEVAGALQLARSRIDQFAATSRLYARNRVLDTIEALLALQEAIEARAREWKDVVAPGYTHFQHAHPWNLGHYALAHFDVYSRDVERLFQTYARVNLSALGGVALSGTSWSIDRRRTAALLGHGGLVRNSKDAGFFAMEFPSEIASVLAILLSGLNLFGSELDVWGTWEFGLVELDAGLCGTSSAMPQKRNPYALERIRALAGEAIGWTASQLGLLKMPNPTEADLMFGTMRTESYFDAAQGAVRVMTDVVRTLSVNHERMAKLADANWGSSSSLADEMVQRCNLDFRRAHHIVGTLVRILSERHVSPQDATSAHVDEAAMEVIGRPLGLGDDVVRSALDARAFVATRTSEGSVGPREVEALLASAKADLQASRSRLQAERARQAEARATLDRAIAAILSD